MIDAEETVNPIYGRMLKLVNEALIKEKLTRVSPGTDEMPPYRLRHALRLKECLPDDYPFKPTRHEVSTWLCADFVIEGEYRRFFDDSSPLPVDVDPVQSDTFERLADYAARFPRLLRWALLLHDIAKDRYPRFPEQEADNPGRLDHPKLCKMIVETISEYITGKKNRRGYRKELGDYCLDPAAFEVVLWLVDNHDILGNMFTGERAPRFLLKIMQTSNEAEKKHRLSLLQVVGLCDLWSTADGQFLTEQKARYWLSLADRGSIAHRQRTLYDWRLRRWTGDLIGRDNPTAAAYVQQALDSREGGILRRPPMDVFGDGIDYVIYGFYLFTSLSKEELATLLALVLKEYNNLVPKGVPSITLAFEKYKPWEPDTEEVLKAYRVQIERRRLVCEYDPADRTLRVLAPLDNPSSC